MATATEIPFAARRRHVARWYIGPCREALEALEEIHKRTPAWRWMLRRRQERGMRVLRAELATLRYYASR